MASMSVINNEFVFTGITTRRETNGSYARIHSVILFGNKIEKRQMILISIMMTIMVYSVITIYHSLL